MPRPRGRAAARSSSVPDLEQVGHHDRLLPDGQVVGVAELLDAGDLRAALVLLGREGEQRVVDRLRDEAAGGEGVGGGALGEDRGGASAVCRWERIDSWTM